MAKIHLSRLGAGSGHVDLLNDWARLIEEAFDNTVSRDGTVPNQLEADIDLNGNALLNSEGDPQDPNRVLTYSQMTDYVAAHSSGIVVLRQEAHVATAAQTVFNLSTMEFVPGTGNLAVYVEGVRKFAPLDYTETDSNTITFLSGVSIGNDVVFVLNEYLGTVNLPAHNHTWAQIQNPPAEATRWPTWSEVTGKPTTFAPATHVHDAADIASGRLADARRGVYVQASAPTGLGPSDAGALRFW